MRKFLVGAGLLFAAVSLPAQQMVTETRDPAQQQDADFEKSVKEWTGQPYFSSPLVDHLPVVQGVPTPKDILGHHIGAPKILTRTGEALKYYRALERQSDVAFRASPLKPGARLPRYQVDRSFNYVDSVYERPGPAMVVYHLRNCGT